MKTRTRVVASLGLVGATTTLTAVAEAGEHGSVWRLAATPALVAAESAMPRIRRLEARLARQPTSSSPTEPVEARIRELETELTEAGASTSGVPNLRLAFARFKKRLFERDGNPAHLEEATQHLESVIASERGLPTELAAAAQFDLGMCHALLGQRGRESTAYAEALRLEANPAARSLLLANHADARMALGDLSGALRGYRAALATWPASALVGANVTTLWGLAVAYDRSGRLAEALETVAIARSYDPQDSQLHGSSWVFLPAREAHWYAALGAWSLARSAEDAARRGAALREAAALLRRYLAEAPPDDRWRRLAEARIAQCEREATRDRANP